MHNQGQTLQTRDEERRLVLSKKNSECEQPCECLHSQLRKPRTQSGTRLWWVTYGSVFLATNYGPLLFLSNDVKILNSSMPKTCLN